MEKELYVMPEEAAEFFDNIDGQKVTPRMLFSLCMLELLCDMLSEAREEH